MSGSLIKPGLRVGGSMIRLSLPFFYALGSSLRTAAAIMAGHKLRDVWGAAYTAKNDLAGLLQTGWFAPAMKAAIQPGNALWQALHAITERTDFDAEITHMEAHALSQAFTQFDTVLRSELLIADTYFVTGKYGYDTSTLIGSAENHFPPDLGLKAPNAIVDLREAGKCLAFELSTAAGFHVLRATESVCRVYWTAASGGKAHPHPKTLGTYARKLDEGGYGKKKTVHNIKQITDLHRNPLIHPSDTLTLDEAIGLFGICRSAISAMLAEIPTPPAITPPPSGGGPP